MPDLRQQLERCFRGRVGLMGLGNPDHGDDGLGVRLAEELAAEGLPEVVIAGAAPERFVGRFAGAGYDHVIFLDAVEFGCAPGSVVWLDAATMEARFPQISTHRISLGALARWVENDGATKAWLLGVQPESLRPAQQLTPAVGATVEVLRELLISLSPAEAGA